MAHTYANLLCHCVFSTKGRQKLMSAALRERLWPYMGGIARKNGTKALAVGGTEDHVHLLLSLPTTMGVAKAIQLIKAGSSKWISESIPSQRRFAWQKGYGAFSVSVSHLEETVTYIDRQEEHHRDKTCQEEYVAFLKRHGIDYDPAQFWG